MQESASVSYLHALPAYASLVDVKVEEDGGRVFTTHHSSPAPSPSPSPSYVKSIASHTFPFPSTRRRGPSFVGASLRRARHPYLPHSRDSSREKLGSLPSGMSNTPNYPAYKGQPTPPGLVRRSSDGDRHAPPGYPQFPQSPLRGHDMLRPQTPNSLMTASSLAGAMGDARISSPASAAMLWPNTDPHSTPSMHDYANTGQFPSSPPDPSNFIGYSDYDAVTLLGGGPEQLSPSSADFNIPYPNQYTYRQSRGIPTLQSPPPIITSKGDSFSGAGVASSYPLISAMPSALRGRSSDSSDTEEELQFLRKRVRELELVNESSRMRIQELEMELAQDQSLSSFHSGPPPPFGQASPSTPSSPENSPSFLAAWKTRTDARVRQFCSLNRAGNALCAWHETRRERRAHPPRLAPPGFLNCGCTFAEALFEESLARHGVGSYHPGESVRMDPALRNPLLKLLEARYNYRDGDFERDSATGAWLEGEGPIFWEQRALLGVSNRRGRGDST